MIPIYFDFSYSGRNIVSYINALQLLVAHDHMKFLLHSSCLHSYEIFNVKTEFIKDGSVSLLIQERKPLTRGLVFSFYANR